MLLDIDANAFCIVKLIEMVNYLIMCLEPSLLDLFKKF